MPHQRNRIFISYSHEDSRWLECIREQLASLEKLGLIDVFVDTSIIAGEDWKARIDSEMLRAKLAVLLVSPTFLNSPFIQDEEIPRLLDRHAKEGMNIYPILVRDCLWDKFDWLARIQMRPHHLKPIAGLRKNVREQALVRIASELAGLVLLSTREEGLPESEPIDGANGSRISTTHEEPHLAEMEPAMETLFINSFSAYCDHCAKMMKRAVGEVRTVQTPSRVAGDSRSFREYLSVTADKIVRPSGQPTFGVTLYRRLVVVDAASFESEAKKLEVFFEALREATERAKLENVRELDLSCLGICIVHRETMARFFHSNLDVHITGANECAVAFQRPTTGQAGRENIWQTCLYVRLDGNSNAERLIQSFDQVWSQGIEVLAETIGAEAAHLEEIKHAAITALSNVAYGKIDVRSRTSAIVRNNIEKTLAYSNRFFEKSKHIKVQPRALAALVREWHAITRAFALQTPQYVALIAKECLAANSPDQSRRFERALQIASSISAGEFGIGVPLSNEIHFRLFSELSSIVGVEIADLHRDREGTWPETKAVTNLFKKSFEDLYRGAGVLCTIEVTAFHIVEAMMYLFRGHRTSYVDLHLEIEEGHAELADELCNCIRAALNAPDSAEIIQGANDICDALGRFWNRMADEVFQES